MDPGVKYFTAMHSAQMSRPQQSRLRSSGFLVSLSSLYGGNIPDISLAHVQQASSVIADHSAYMPKDVRVSNYFISFPNSLRYILQMCLRSHVHQ